MTVSCGSRILVPTRPASLPRSTPLIPAAVGRSWSDSTKRQARRMTLAELVPLILKLSTVLLVFVLGLQSEADDIVHLLHRPGLLVRSLIAMNTIMVVIAAAIDAIFPLPEAMKVALLALA